MGGGAAQASAQAPPVAQHPPGGQLPVLLLDVMDTVVYDPFFHDMPRFFGLSFKELLAAKHPTAWIQVGGGVGWGGLRCAGLAGWLDKQ